MGSISGLKIQFTTCSTCILTVSLTKTRKKIIYSYGKLLLIKDTQQTSFMSLLLRIRQKSFGDNAINLYMSFGH